MENKEKEEIEFTLGLSKLRKEYHILPAVLMDAFDEGEARGAHQKALETARLMKQANCEMVFIEKMTGLSQEEVETLT